MNHLSRRQLNCWLCLLSAAIFLGGFSQNTFAQTANPNASPQAKSVLQYLVSLKSKTSNRLLIGQDLGHGSDIDNNFNSYVTNLEQNNGQQLGLIGGDYGTDPGHDFNVSNQRMIDQWNRGGLVTISWHFNNPWNGGSSWNRENVGSFYDLINPNTAVGQTWHAQLDEIANQFQPLESAGVPVLFRPFHEMNGDWFWWGPVDADNVNQGDINEFKALYQHMFNYLTYTKGLNNLLWVYSTGTTYDVTSADFYPGPGYIDVVGIDIYDDAVRMRNVDAYGNLWGGGDHYSALQSLNHPMGITEFGPSHGLADGSYNMMRLVNRVKNVYPDVVFSLSWHDYSDNIYLPREYHAINSNTNQWNVLNDSSVANLSDVDLDSDSGSMAGKLRLRNRYTTKCLAATTYLPRRVASTYVWQPGHLSMQWHLEETDQPDVYRLRCQWKHPNHASNYLHGTATTNGARVRAWEDQPAWYWQRWKLESAGGNFYRLKNVVSNKYLNANMSNVVSTYVLDENWWSQMWELEYID